jgi:ABC-type multidrug transport system fused ATPase/permease subunit
MLGYTYPLLDIFWTMFWIFAFVVWIWLLVYIFVDIFRSHDMGGFAKALWVIFIIILPLLGVLVYLIARGGKMHERAMQQAQTQEKQFQQYVRETAGSGGTADELSKLAQLRDNGTLTEEEFQAQKAKLLS